MDTKILNRRYGRIEDVKERYRRYERKKEKERRRYERKELIKKNLSSNKNKSRRGRTPLIEDSVKLQVYIPKWLDRKLRLLVSQKRIEYKSGGLSLEVTDALIHWIHLHDTQNTQKINPPNKVRKVVTQIATWFKEKYGIIPYQTSLKELKMAISEVRGCDKRTIKKWLKILQQYDYIKHVAGAVWELNFT